MGAVFFDRVGTLRQAPLFRHFSESELFALVQHATLRRFRRNDLLVFEGEPPQGVFVLAEGCVRIFREGRDGREQIIRNEAAVNVLNETQLFDGRPHSASISASEDCILITLPLADCRQRLQACPPAIQEALQLLTSRLHSALDLVDSLSLLSVDQRVAQFLLEQARHCRNAFRPELRVDLAFSNQQIGATVGAVREVVSRSLRKLHLLGLIVCEGRTFTIPNESRLEEFIDSGMVHPLQRSVASF